MAVVSVEIKEIYSAVESILFASGVPLSADKIAEAIGIEKDVIIKLTNTLIDRYIEEKRGIRIIRFDNDRYQMCSNPDNANYVRNIMAIKKNSPLSSASMEVLAIIAYNQPVTKSFIEQVRGVDCSGIIANLITKELIEEKGRLELPGRPLIYGTTDNFLRCFNISSIEELPPLPQNNIDSKDKKQETPLETLAEGSQ